MRKKRQKKIHFNIRLRYYLRLGQSPHSFSDNVIYPNFFEMLTNIKQLPIQVKNYFWKYLKDLKLSLIYLRDWSSQFSQLYNNTWDSTVSKGICWCQMVLNDVELNLSQPLRVWAKWGQGTAGFQNFNSLLARLKI